MSQSESGSAEARVAQLWQEHRGWIAALLYAHMPRHADLDDLLQDVAMKLVRNIDTLDSPDRLGPWLRTVALNAARTAGRQYQRIERRRQSLDDDGIDVEVADRTGDRAEASNARGRAALEIVHSLPPEYREPLVLSLRGLSYRQVSAALNLPVSTIETRLFRARAMVRNELATRDQDTDQTAAHAGPEPHSTQAAR